MLRVLVDDARDFLDGRPALVARSSADALAVLASVEDRRIDELWLDHDLVGDDTVQPVVDHLVEAARSSRPLHVGAVIVHSANIRAGHRILDELLAAGYPARRSFAARMWRHTWTR